MSKLYKILLASSIVALVAVCIGMFANFIVSERVQRNAEEFLADIQTFRIGDPDTTAISELTSKYGRYLSYRRCTQSGCRLSFLFDNYRMVRLHLGHPIEFAGGVETQDGKVVVIAVEAQSAPFIAMTTESNLFPSERNFELNHIADGAGKSSRTIVRVKPGATELERQKAFSYDLHCFSKLKGCSDSRELLPSAGE